MRTLVKVVLLAEAFAVATYGLGWWTVPIIAALFALFCRSDRTALVCAACAAGGWATLLLLDMAKGPVGEMGKRLGGVMSLPPSMLYLTTLVFPALLAWAAAAIVPRLRAASR